MGVLDGQYWATIAEITYLTLLFMEIPHIKLSTADYTSQYVPETRVRPLEAPFPLAGRKIPDWVGVWG